MVMPKGATTHGHPIQQNPGAVPPDWRPRGPRPRPQPAPPPGATAATDGPTSPAHTSDRPPNQPAVGCAIPLAGRSLRPVPGPALAGTKPFGGLRVTEGLYP